MADTPTNIIDQIKRDEDDQHVPGARFHVFNDTRGVPTIGYGRNLRDNGISEEEADFLLRNDEREIDDAITTALPWTTDLADSPRFSVLVNMAFNMGIAGLLQFKQMLAHVEAGEWAAAADAMLDSEWASQVGARAQRLAVQMRTGIWQ